MTNGLLKKLKRKKFPDSNEDEDKMYQNLQNMTKAVLRSKFIAKGTHIRILERFQTNNLMMPLKLLGKNKNKPIQTIKKSGRNQYIGEQNNN
jgi:hypothetical protein